MVIPGVVVIWMVVVDGWPVTVDVVVTLSVVVSIIADVVGGSVPDVVVVSSV